MSFYKLQVAHSLSSWLPLTMNWIFSQLKYAKDIGCIVIADTTKNLEIFPWEPVYSVDRSLENLLFRITRRLGLRVYPNIYDRAITVQNPQIIHSHFGNRGWYDLSLAKKHSINHVVTFYGYDVNRLPTQRPLWRERYQELFGQADLILCEGPYMANSIVELGCPEAKVRIQRLGIEFDRIPFIPRVVGDIEYIRVLIAGTFREKKGIPYALEAIAILRNKYRNLQVTIIGDSAGEKRDEEEKKRILDVIDRYQLWPITRLLGFQTHDSLMAEAYDHHIFLSPSLTASDGDTEGGAPVTIIEMAASGMPVISTKHCDIPQVIKNQQTGLLCEERDAEGLAEHLDWLIEHPQEWPCMLTAARNHVERNFNAYTQGVRLSKIYESVLSKG